MHFYKYLFSLKKFLLQNFIMKIITINYFKSGLLTSIKGKRNVVAGGLFAYTL